MSQVAGPDISTVDFGLTEEQHLLQQEVRRFAEERVRPGTAERDRNYEFPVDVVRGVGEWGPGRCGRREGMQHWRSIRSTFFGARSAVQH